MLTKNHLLIAFALVIAACVTLAIAPGGGEVGGRLSLLDAFTGLAILLGGALAQAKGPKD